MSAQRSIRFAYRGLDGAGQVQDGHVTAADEGTATQQLGRQGIVILSLRRDADRGTQPGKRQGSFWVRAFPAKKIRLLLRMLSEPLRIGLTISVAVDTAIDQTGDYAIAGALRTIKATMKSGGSFRDGMALAIPSLPNSTLSLIEAGERSGSLPDMIRSIEDQMARQLKLQAEVRSALIYPGIVAAVACCVMAVFVHSIIPTIAELVGDRRADLQPVAQFVLWINDVVSEHGLLITLGIVGALVAVLGGSRWTPVRSWWQRVGLRIPLWGKVLIDQDASRFARTLAAQIGGGLPIGRAIRQSAASLDVLAFRVSAEQLDAKLAQGISLSDALRSDLPQFPRDIFSMVRIGEQTGCLKDMLDHAADAIETSLQDRVRALAALMTPLLTVILGLVVGVIVLSLMSAISDLNGALLK